jgi:hypothetical protein
MLKADDQKIKDLMEKLVQEKLKHELTKEQKKTDPSGQVIVNIDHSYLLLLSYLLFSNQNALSTDKSSESEVLVSEQEILEKLINLQEKNRHWQELTLSLFQ